MGVRWVGVVGVGVACCVVLEMVVAWYDGVELWLVQLAYPLQVALVLAVLVPLCWGVARGVDRALDVLAARFARGRDVRGRGERGRAA
ncbi:hypothetical protein GCM10009854_29990 [Saccharopolyspora halophila]|uniref:Uncharacterized protein n=2 Tax=Saccharopolyspora halophila TaxID=405551 RepID=A0ABN3GH41_9PSEU